MKTLKIRSYALIYVLMISLMLSLTISFMLLGISHLREIDSRLDIERKLSESNRQLRKLALSRHYSDSDNLSFEFYPGIKSTLKKDSWGIFEIMLLKSKSGNDSLMETAYIGTQDYTFNDVALYLKDSGRSLHLSGKSRIKGKAFIPNGAAEYGMVSNRSHNGEGFVNGNIYPSNTKQTETIFIDLVHKINHEKRRYISNSFSSKLTQSFSESTLWIQLGKMFRVENCELKGRIILEAREKLIISKTAILEDVILMAPQILVESGAEINAQLLATTAIKINQETTLKYPSLLYLSVNQENDSAQILIERNSRLSGMILAFSGNGRIHNPIVLMENESSVSGLIYCAGPGEIKGVVQGSLIIDDLIYTKGGSYYLSYLHDANIDNSILSENFALPDLTAMKKDKTILKWIE